MIVLILVALWAVVLAPALLKKWLDRRSTVSIDIFHEQLHLLERAGPKLVDPAYRLETAQSSAGIAVGQSGYPAVSSRPSRPNLVLLKPVGDHEAGPAVGDEVVETSSGEHFWRVGPPVTDDEPSRRLAAARIEELRRHQAQRRRRDVLLGLASTLVITGFLGLAVPVFWVLTVLAAVSLGGYLGLAAYAQLLEADRRHGLHSQTGLRSRPVPAGRPDGEALTWQSRTGDGWAATAGFPGAWDDADDGDEEVPRAVAR
jgi:hypothetical protein